MRSLLPLLAAVVVLALPLRAQPQSAANPALQAQQPAASDTTRTGPPPEFRAPPATRPLRGVVWRPGPDLAQAVRTLQRMKAAGVEAVRTPLIRREALLAAADSLRIRLFQDLPAAYLSAGGVAEAVGDLRWELERALLMARRHPSARHFGLLSRSDTSVPVVCEVLREFSERVHTYGPEGTVTYYETPFIEEDRCRGATDLTLLDMLNEAEPQDLLRRWHQARPDTAAASDSVAVGIGALGTWVDPEAYGLRAPHSPQSQARYFEEHLPPLLRPDRQGGSALGGGSTLGVRDTAQVVRSDSLDAPAVVFAYRWRDLPDAASQEAAASAKKAVAPQSFALEDPYGRRYGLHTAAGRPRPAMRVVRGLYTGQQTVFAFEGGEAPPGRWPWLVLVGWGLAAVLGVFYASASRFRGMVERYFSSPGFYRDSIREGRDVLGGSGLVLLAAVSLCVGIIVTVFLLAVQETGPFVQLLRGASGETQRWIFTLLQRPWMAILIVAGGYFAGLGGWAFFLSLATQQAYPLRTTQTLVLVTWPRWPVFILAAAAVVAATLPPGWMLPVSGGLVAAWVLVSIGGAVRTLYDLAQLAELPLVAAPALALLNPILIAAVMVFFAVLEFLPEATFLWHLATRS